MAMGKVVMSGAEPECLEEFELKNIPIINILPDPQDIYNKIKSLVLNKKSITKIGQESRKFVETFHDSHKVAKQYLEVWSS
jgi:glycosyltransferase involved in cell wall biosynthesis